MRPTTASILFSSLLCVVQLSGAFLHIGVPSVKSSLTYHMRQLSPPTQQSIVYPSTTTLLLSSYSADVENGETNEISEHTSKITAESILNEFHKSKYVFRIIVIGNGAILETTNKLGPTYKSSISPKSGERLLTFASEDQSFEFHVKIEQICKICFVATSERRVARFLSESGTPICSLILGDSSAEAGEWFDGLIEKFGNELIM